MSGALTDLDVLHLQESGRRLTTVERALLILAAACPELTQQQAEALTIGERDARLLSIRERTFGPALDVFTTCPACQQDLQLSLSASGLRLGAEGDSQHADTEFSAEFDDCRVRYRLPDSTDLQAAAACDTLEAARSLLLERCIVDLQRDGSHPPTTTSAPVYADPELAAALAAEMARRDPQAEVLLNLRCAGCQHEWQSLFDIATFFWTELETHARRLLNEIYVLARVYHWREQDILELPPARRRWYLEMATA